jgi:hypothetical protein
LRSGQPSAGSTHAPEPGLTRAELRKRGRLGILGGGTGPGPATGGDG